MSLRVTIDWSFRFNQLDLLSYDIAHKLFGIQGVIGDDRKSGMDIHLQPRSDRFRRDVVFEETVPDVVFGFCERFLFFTARPGHWRHVAALLKGGNSRRCDFDRIIYKRSGIFLLCIGRQAGLIDQPQGRFLSCCGL